MPPSHVSVLTRGVARRCDTSQRWNRVCGITEFFAVPSRKFHTPTNQQRLHTLPAKLFHSTSEPQVSTGVAKFLRDCATINGKRRLEALKSYRAARAETDPILDSLLKKNKLVLFLDGVVDAPRSQLSHNVVKMLTQVQAVPLISIDIGGHPAIEGYALEKSGNPERGNCPLLFKNGAAIGGHDELLRMFSSGQLQQSIGSEGTRSSSKYYKGELPIASY